MLAINGGSPVRTTTFPAYRTIGAEEKAAVSTVLDSGVLSKFLGCWHDDFHGGPEVRALEQEWAEYMGVRHAIAVNSCTSGLYCAVGAAGVEPGQEVIVSPYTMSASATAPLIYSAIPVFADIEDDYYCLSAESIEKQITPQTKAIIIVDIFGQPYDSEAVNYLAAKHNLVVIEDAAQAPGGRNNDKYTGTLGDIGVYSLNYHKHIHCGEGGIIVTDNDEFAERLRLIRNHAEAVVEQKGVTNLTNMVGFNFRMTEMEAAVARCQLRKLEGLLSKRIENCNYLADALAEIPAVTPAPLRPGCRHSFYVQPFEFNEESAGVSRDRFIDAVKAELQPTELRESEGVCISTGYVKPLYLQPLFQNQTAFGSTGFPFKNPWNNNPRSYNNGLCPVTERKHEKQLFLNDLMHSFMGQGDLDDVITAFNKVWEARKELS